MKVRAEGESLTSTLALLVELGFFKPPMAAVMRLDGGV